MSHIPIHVAIPSYNNAEGLRQLLVGLSAQSFDSITVMDDASTDHTKEVVSSFPEVVYIRSEINGGPVAAKNLILKKLPEDGFILFIDSDMQLITQDIPERLRDFLREHPRVGGGSGIIRSKEGDIVPFNGGYDVNPLRVFAEVLIQFFFIVLSSILSVRKLLRKMKSYVRIDFDESAAKKVDWSVEGFFFVRADLFKQCHGFDQRFIRFHEGPDLCLQIRRMGYQIWFFPGIEVKNLDQQTGTSFERQWHWVRSTIIYFYKNPSRLFIYRYPRP